MSSNGHDIVVIGTSAGGLEVLDRIMGGLPDGIPGAAVFIVQHMAPENKGQALLHRLGKHKSFNCTLARDGAEFKKGWVYIAPGDYHLLVKQRTMLVTRGARENRYRPGIDPLFRSAAVAHGPSVVGAILSGALDDGTAGLIAVHKCGGVTVVQDPKDAAYPQMPQSALDNMKVDHCVAATKMGGLLERLTRQRHGPRRPIPAEVRTEALIAERVLSDIKQVNGLGNQVPYNCPNCGGVLWEMDAVGPRRYRCHTGHSFTDAALLAIQSEKIEETLWVSLRMFEERKNLLNSMKTNGMQLRGEAGYAERAKEAEVHIERIRAMLLASETKGVVNGKARRGKTGRRVVNNSLKKREVRR
jgi:two-component system chemotaxis response regulator CheB